MGEATQARGLVQIRLHDGRLMATLDTTAQAEATVLEGSTPLRRMCRRRPSTPKPSMTARDLHEVDRTSAP